MKKVISIWAYWKNGKIMKNKIFDCITFFDNNFMFEIRYNILSNFVDYFVICESKYDHKGNIKKKNFILISIRIKTQKKYRMICLFTVVHWNTATMVLIRLQP